MYFAGDRGGCTWAFWPFFMGLLAISFVFLGGGREVKELASPRDPGAVIAPIHRESEKVDVLGNPVA
jgi:hypothetical protein